MLGWFRRTRPAPRAGNAPEPAGPELRLRQELERDKAAEPSVLGLVNHTHAAATEFLDDAVVGDGFANHRVGQY